MTQLVSVIVPGRIHLHVSVTKRRANMFRSTHVETYRRPTKADRPSVPMFTASAQNLRTRTLKGTRT